MDKNWQNDPKLKNMDSRKLAMLQALAEEGSGKSARALLPFFMNAASGKQNGGLNFTQEETEIILEVLKSGKSRAEADRIDRVASLMKMIR